MRPKYGFYSTEYLTLFVFDGFLRRKKIGAETSTDDSVVCTNEALYPSPASGTKKRITSTNFPSYEKRKECHNTLTHLYLQTQSQLIKITRSHLMTSDHSVLSQVSLTFTPPHHMRINGLTGETATHNLE